MTLHDLLKCLVPHQKVQVWSVNLDPKFNFFREGTAFNLILIDNDPHLEWEVISIIPDVEGTLHIEIK